MESDVKQFGFTPYIGEGFISPNRKLVTDVVKDIVTEHPSFARAIQKRCLGSAGRLALPVTFMSKYLVGSEGLVVLEDKGGMLWKVYWIAYMQSGRRLAFTRGWPAFVSHHDGKDGDIFIAEIVAPDHLRVQFISSNFNHGRQSHCGGAFSPKDPAPVNETASEDFKRNLQHFADGKEQVSNDSPLSFLLQESKILRRKRSKMMSRAVALHDSIGRPLESTSHADKLLDTCTVHACKPRSSVQACQLSSSMASVLFSKNDMNENLGTKCHEKYIKETFYRKSADVQPRTMSHKLLSNVAGSTTTIYDKKRKYGAQFCQYTKDSCNLYVLHGFKFCMLHILEDCSAPYKQCDFIEKQTRVRCGFPVCLNLSDPRFCQIHRQSDNLVGEIELGSSFLNVVPAFGKFSSIMMAVTVSHHLSEKTDLWICSKSNCLPNAHIFWDQQYEKPGAGWAKLFTRRISDLHHDVIEESNDSTSQEVTLVSVKANLENISRYVGWRSSVSLNSEGRTNISLYNTGDFLDGEEEEKELQTNTNNFVQKNASQSEYKISLRVETDVEEHDSSAVQPQARRACCSKFVGVRKRPWGAYGAEICTSEGKRLWLGTFSTEKEAALAYDDAARVLRGNGAVTNFSQGQNLVRGERSDRSTEAPEQRSVLRKRGRSVGTKKYYDAYPVETSEKLLDLTHSFLDGSIEDHNLIQSRVNLLDDGIFSPGFKQGVQSLPTMKTERDFFKLEKCELPEAKQDLCLEHLNEQQISEWHWSSSPCLPMETENADQHNLESSMSCLKQSILHGSSDSGKKLNGTKSLSFCQPGDRGEVHSDDSDILFTPCESKVMKELQKNFTELKEEFGSEMTHAVESEVSDITQLNGSTSFVPEGNMTIIGGFPNCNTRRNSDSPGKFQILSELNVEEKTVLSLGFCLKL